MSEEKIDIKTATVKLQKYSNFRIIARSTFSCTVFIEQSI